MRTKRIKESGNAYYHIVSRVVDRRFVFDHEEREWFRKVMRDAEAFSGVQVLTYAAMSNHFHILLHVPERTPISDELLLERLKHLYTPLVVKQVAESLLRLRQNGETTAADALVHSHSVRMYDLSEFMKTLKQRLTQSYNRRHGRKGTLWEERFKSILVEGQGNALSTIASYIDLNPVRAGLVEDPKDFRHSGYGEAVGGSELARQGLMRIVSAMGECATWREAAARYRQLVYISGEEQGVDERGHATHPGLDRKAVQGVLDNGGHLPKSVLLRCRVRYFTDGVVLGSKHYVDDVFHRHRDQFSPKRKTGARALRGGGWGDLSTVRRLRLTPITA